MQKTINEYIKEREKNLIKSFLRKVEKQLKDFSTWIQMSIRKVLSQPK